VQERLRHLVKQPLDWDVVWRLARRHGVAPLVFHTLTTTGAIEPCDDRLARFRAHFLSNAANSRVLTQELLDVLERFDRSGVTATAYKGAALAALLYGNIALREFSDLDVIVRPHDVPAARKALLAYGYEPAMPLTSMQEKRLVESGEGYYLRFDRHNATGRIALELHWRIPSTFRLDVPFGQRCTSVSILGRDVAHVEPEDLLLLLCVHGFKHAWNQLKWICDVAELIERRPMLDWNRALEHARRAGGLRVVLLGCAMAHITLEPELPPAVSDRIVRDSIVSTLVARLRQRLFDRPLPRPGVINNIRIRERIPDKIRYAVTVAGQLSTPTLSERLTWPSWPGAHAVYRLCHPFRLVGRVARKHRRWNAEF
jgi:hypothetical protein